MQDYWEKQTDKPLFDDILWSRPVTKATAGKLLIAGGNDHSFAAPAQAYQGAGRAGIGTCQVAMPDAVKKLVGSMLPEGTFLPSTPSGSFALKALGELLDLAAWADGVLWPGDLGRNSETAILLETFLKKFPGQVTLTRDAADYFLKTPAPVLDRPQTTLVLSLAQLQKLAIHAGVTQAITFDIDFLNLIGWLHEFTNARQVNIIVKHHLQLFVSATGKVSTTRLPEEQEIWRLQTAAAACVFWLQNPTRALEALTTAVYQSINGSVDPTGAAA